MNRKRCDKRDSGEQTGKMKEESWNVLRQEAMGDGYNQAEKGSDKALPHTDRIKHTTPLIGNSGTWEFNTLSI